VSVLSQAVHHSLSHHLGGSILTAAYYMLKNGTSYSDLGPDYFTRRNEALVALRLTQRLKELGYEVESRKVA